MSLAIPAFFRAALFITAAPRRARSATMGTSVEIWSRSFLVSGARQPTLPKTVSPGASAPLALANPSRRRGGSHQVDTAHHFCAVVEMVVVIGQAGDDRGAPKIDRTRIRACERLDC